MLMRVLILSRGGDRQADVAIVAGETGGVEPPDHAPCRPLGWSLGGSVGELGGYIGYLQCESCAKGRWCLCPGQWLVHIGLARLADFM